MGAIGISAVFYLVQVLGMQSWTAPYWFITDNWYLVLPLIVGFSVQMWLFRAIHLHNKHGGGVAMATSGGLSSTAMLACCSHNLVFLLPVLGASGVAAFFAAYQTQVFIVSIAFVFIGVGYMWLKYREVRK